jgi:hypothetical protein
MQLSLLALVVIPELRISDKGLVDIARLEFVPVLQSEAAESVPSRSASKSARGHSKKKSKKA